MNRQSALRVGTMVNQGEGLGIKPVFAKGMPEVGTVVYGLARDHSAHRSTSNRTALVPFGEVRDADSYGPCIHFQGVWEEGSPLFVMVDRSLAERRVLELIDSYWSLAYQEGLEQRTHDTEEGSAQATRSELEESIRLLR